MVKNILIGVVIVNIVAIVYSARELPKLRDELRKRNTVSLSPQLEERLGHEIGDVVTNVACLANKAMQEVISNSATGIDRVTSDCRTLARERILGNEDAAERAYEFAEKALDAKEPDLPLARLYCMNAINHSPTQKKYFERLVEVANRSNLNTAGDWEQIRAALEIGLYQVSAEDVLELRKLLAGVLIQIGRLEEDEHLAQLAQIKEQTEDALSTLRQGELCLDRVLARTGSARLQLLRERDRIIQELDKGVLSDGDASWVEHEDLATRTLMEYCEYVRVIDEYLSKAEAYLKGDCTNMGSVSVLVHMASQVLGQAWAIDVNSLPKDFVADLHDYARRIEDLELKFNRAKSQPAIDAIKSLLAKMEVLQVASPYQRKIEAIELGMAAIVTHMSQVYDSAARVELENALRQITNKLGLCRQAQYKAYQEWAIERCDAGMKRYKEWMRVDIVDAEEVINNYLIEIDSTLLTPDVGRLYQDVLGKQFAELKDHTASMEIKLAKAKKRQLKDF